MPISEKWKTKKREAETTAQVSAIQAYLLEQLLQSLSESVGPAIGPQLAQAVVDRLFARQLSLLGKERSLADKLSVRLVRENEPLRETVSACLTKMLEVESSKHNFPAKRRILDTIEWLKQFGDLPREVPLAEAFDGLRRVSILEIGKDDDLNSDLLESGPNAGQLASKVTSGQTDRPEGETWQIT